MLPALLDGDEEEQSSARKAVRVILYQKPGKVLGTLRPVTPSASLQNWIAFISKKIRDAREGAGLTQMQLAKKSGLLQGQISRLEQGQHSPTAKTLEKIAHATGRDVGFFDPST